MATRANLYQLADKACLVTGCACATRYADPSLFHFSRAASGFGALLAMQLAVEKGAKVALVDRNAELGRKVLASTLKGLEAKGVSDGRERVIFIEADLSSTDDVERAFRTTIEAFGTLDVVVNNGEERLVAHRNAAHLSDRSRRLGCREFR